MTDAREVDVERDVVRSDFAAGDGGLGQRLGRRRGGIGGNSAHDGLLFVLIIANGKRRNSAAHPVQRLRRRP